MSERSTAHSPAWLRGNRNLVLFLSLMLMIVLLPAFEHSRRGELLFTVVSMFIVSIAVVVNGRSRLLFWITLVLAAPALALRSAAFFTDSEVALLWSWGFSAGVLVATMLRLLQDVFEPGAVSRDRLFACVTVYVLIGLLWCYFYAIVAELSPGAFTGLDSSSKILSVAELAYFSFNVVLTVALTDMLPVNRTAQMLVLLQEFASVFYMAFVIARLVGMYSAPAAASSDANDGSTISKRDP